MKIYMVSLLHRATINDRYIPEHQNKLNICDLQNYEFLRIFFNRKKLVKFVEFKNEKNSQIRILDLCFDIVKSVGKIKTILKLIDHVQCRVGPLSRRAAAQHDVGRPAILSRDQWTRDRSRATPASQRRCIHTYRSVQKNSETRMWANAQPDGRPM